ncbi:hypothetical protein LTR84_003365 [Exophiala bonariae]|uniref:C2 NT-type domain-containing protein n=1 Tax=Exophiala bonariae TaxID=1690606 RepID=A0AAV9NAG7_9EURO|nr:hypothetical protein LTR84_003365 [Exophiala bonariae]
MEINFKQPRGSKITWATVQVSLDGEHQALQPYRDNTILDLQHLVAITHLGPSQLFGEPLTIAETRALRGTPTISFPGGELSGLGADGQRSYEHSTRWKFTGDRKPRDDGESVQLVYNTLEWELTENDFEKQSSHGNKFQTAFAFANNGQPFLLRVEIQGRTHGVGGRVKNKVKEAFKFGSRAHQEETISTTLVRGFGGQLRGLNEEAQRLDDEMMKKNEGVRYPGTRNSSTTDLASQSPDPSLKINPPATSGAGGGNVNITLSDDDKMQLKSAAMSLISPQPQVEPQATDGARTANASSNPTVKKDPEVKAEPQDDEQHQSKQQGQQKNVILNQEKRQKQPMNRNVLEALIQIFGSWIWAIVRIFSGTSESNIS